MSNRECIATIDEFESLMTSVVGHYGYEFEWYFAIRSGWDKVEFANIYRDYVGSTQVKIRKGDNAAEVKGVPLEKLSMYFLERGGVARNIREISAHQKWQVDGQGPLNKTALIMCFGERICKKLGFQLYMEAKNHLNPVDNNEFSSHYRRMAEHGCNLGIFFSTSGYKITRGSGIAESIHHNFLLSRFHLLLSFHSIHSAAVGEKAPLAILQDALCYAANDSFSKDVEVQGKYTKESCQRLATAEFKRLFL